MILLAVVMLDSFLGLGIFVSVIEFFSSLVYRFLGLA